jgi:DNA-binding response OmpR family regulator
MSDQIVLIVSENDRQFRLLAGAIQGRGVVSSPVYQPNGENAIRWLGANHCDACVLSYELPGKRSGLDTLQEMRNRAPDLPIIMISHAGSEKVAIGAFHAGVVDYVPTNKGYELAVADLVSQLRTVEPGETIIPAQLIAGGVAERLMQPTYQNRLRVIGRHLDQSAYRRVNVLEVNGGFVVRATEPDGRQTETLEFADSRFPQLMASCVGYRGEGERRKPTATPMLPTGYEDFLRAIGYRLDEHAAEATTISELDELVVVGGVGRVDEFGNTRYGPLQWLLREAEISFLLNEAYRRRDPQSAAAHGPGILKRLTR